MALQATTNINVDFYDKKYILINAKQHDKKSRFIYIYCYNNGEFYPLNEGEHSAYIRYKKSDNNSVFNFCEIGRKGNVVVELTEQMLASGGFCYADLVITNKGGAKVDSQTGEIIEIKGSSVISTMPIHIDVIETAVANSDIESSYEFNGLNIALEKAEAEYTEVIKTSKSWAVGGTGIRSGEDTDNSKYYAKQSSNSSSAANISALNAANSESLAEEHMQNALLYSQNAATYKANAGTYMDNAKVSETNAYTSEQNSKTSENNAKTSENNANTYMNNANTYMNNANQSADKAYVSEQNAKVSEDNAKASEDNAKVSETNAKTSEDNAKTSEDNAKLSETNSKTSEDNAELYMNNAKTSEDNAKASESNASVSENNAKVSEQNSKTSENNAKTSEDNAESYMNNAKTSEANALNSANLSQSYAVGGTGIRDGEDTNNSQYYYELIKNIVIGLDTGFIPMGTISFSELGTVEKATGYVYNIRDDFMTDENFAEGMGKSYTAGTNVYCRSDGMFDCFGGSAFPSATVDEVKNYLGI